MKLSTTLLTAAAMVLFPWGAYAETELDLTLARSATASADIKDGYEAKLALHGRNWRLWGSYAEHDQVIVTQGVGEISILAAGMGYQGSLSKRVSMYLDAGMAVIDGDYGNRRVMHEGVWFSFCPTFCPAHWREDGNYLHPDLAVESDFEHSPLVQLGAQFAASDRFAIDISLRWLHGTQFMKISDTTDTAHGWWEGDFDRNLSAVSLGFNWSF